MKLSNMKKSETTEQILLFNWARNHEQILPCLSLMYHVPNEGKRTNGSILKAAGLKSGVPDVCLPVPSGEFHGLYLEMKFGKNKTTDEQERFMELLWQQGYKTAVCYGFEDAKAEIIAYLQEPGKMPLENCLNAPWIGGKCDGVSLLGQMFSHEICRKCKKHNFTRQEAIVEKNMASVAEYIKNTIVNDIANLSAGRPMPYTTMEITLETINKNLAHLVIGKQLSIEQSAAVLSVAMDAYEQAQRRKENRA